MFLFWLGFLGTALAAGPVPGGSGVDVPPPYTDTTSSQALRNLEKIGARDPAHLSEAEGVEWVRARFALVALLRLQGKEPEALEAFAGCKSYCAKWGPSSEWEALKKWGCHSPRRKDAAPCRKP